MCLCFKFVNHGRKSQRILSQIKYLAIWVRLSSASMVILLWQLWVAYRFRIHYCLILWKRHVLLWHSSYWQSRQISTEKPASQTWPRLRKGIFVESPVIASHLVFHSALIHTKNGPLDWTSMRSSPSDWTRDSASCYEFRIVYKPSRTLLSSRHNVSV